MATTATTDLTPWIPAVIGSSIYDTMYESDLALSADASTFGELDGKPGTSATIPTLGITTPADDLAETVPAVDDKLSSGSLTVTIKEAVKSIAWYDRTPVQTGQDVNGIVGQRVGGAIADRVELDLGAAAVSGRTVAADTTAATLTIGVLRQMRAKIPAKMRRRGEVVLYAESATLEQLLDDPITQNAATFGSDEAMRDGDFVRPLYGVRLRAVDDGTFPVITAGKKTVILAVRGMLVRAYQKQPSSETERDARARLTRIVGTALHAEGVIDSRGVVAGIIG